MSVFELAAGVFIGVMLAAVCLLSLKAADKKEDWSQVPLLTTAGFTLPLFFMVAVIWAWS